MVCKLVLVFRLKPKPNLRLRTKVNTRLTPEPPPTYEKFSMGSWHDSIKALYSQPPTPLMITPCSPSPNIFLGQNYFGRKFFLDPNFFWTQILFGPLLSQFFLCLNPIRFLTQLFYPNFFWSSILF